MIMKNFKTNIFLFAMLAVSPVTANAQTADEADSATVAKKKVHVAFRDKDADQLLGGISYVDMEELSKKDYTTGSLEDMLSLVGGWNGNNLWGMDNDRLDNNDNSNTPLVITQESSPTPQFKSINSSALSLLHSPTLTSIHDHRKNHSLD